MKIVNKKSKRKISKLSNEETTVKNHVHCDTDEGISSDAEFEGNAIYFLVVCTFLHQSIPRPSYYPTSHPNYGSPSRSAVITLPLAWLPHCCKAISCGLKVLFLFLLFTFISRSCIAFTFPRLVCRVSLLFRSELRPELSA